MSIVTTDIGGGTTTVNGTSYSAPHVAGAVALTRQRFPALSATQIVNALLAAATDLGATGTDTIFGRGLLNVSAALAPLGATSLPAGASEGEEARAMAALDSADMKLGPGFGDSIARALAATPTIVVDSFGRAFVTDVSGYVSPANSGPDIVTLLDPDAAGRTFATEIAALGSLALSFDTPKETSEFARRFAEAPGGAQSLDAPAVNFSTRLGPGTELTLGLSTAAGPDSDAARRAGVNFVSADLLAAPVLGMSGTGESVVLHQRLDRRTTIRLAVAVGTRTFDDPYGERGRSAVALDLDRRFDGGAMLSAHVSALSEEGSFLDTVSSGALEAAGGARTSFLGLSTAVPLGRGWSLQGRSLVGLTEVRESGPGVLSEFSRIRSTSHSLGVVRRAWLNERDSFGLVLFQPLRVEDGSARLSLPVAYDYTTGLGTYRDQRTQLAPTGREVGIELAYGLRFDSGAAVQANLLQRFEPGHVADAGAETTALVQLKIEF